MNGTSAILPTGGSGLVSVIIPCYNYGRFLAEAVLSVIAQTYPCWELIIVDDGSSDNTSAIGYQLQRIYRNHHIEVIRREHGGMNAARNTGVQHSRGAYILALDADDLIGPTFLEKTVDILERHRDVGFAYTQVRLFGNVEAIWRLGQFTLEELKRENQVVCHSLFRRSAWEQCGGYNEAMRLGYEDWDFWLRLAEHGWRWQGIPEPLAYYRRHGTSMIDRARNQSILLRAQIILNHPGLYGPNLVRLAHEIHEIGKDISLEPDMSPQRSAQRRTGRIVLKVQSLVKKRLLRTMKVLPLYYQMVLRKWFFVMQQRRRFV